MAAIALNLSSVMSLRTRRLTSSTAASSLLSEFSHPASSAWASSIFPAVVLLATDDEAIEGEEGDVGMSLEPRRPKRLEDPSPLAEALLRSSDLEGFFLVCLIMRATLRRAVVNERGQAGGAYIRSMQLRTGCLGRA